MQFIYLISYFQLHFPIRKYDQFFFESKSLDRCSHVGKREKKMDIIAELGKVNK